MSTPQVMYPFDNGNVLRNAALNNIGVVAPKAVSTGTTIVALKFKDGICVAADSRATSGNVIADKSCLKLHHITDNIYMAGAGTAADLGQVGRMLSAQMNLLELNTGRKARVAAASRIAKQHVFKYQGQVGAYVILAGVDFYGPHLCSVHAHGSVKTMNWLADGSGSLASTGLLERDYKTPEVLDQAQAVEMVQAAVKAGMQDDLMSGNFFNYKVITKNGVVEEGKFLQPDFAKPQAKTLKFQFGQNSTSVLDTRKIKYDVLAEAMDVN